MNNLDNQEKDNDTKPEEKSKKEEIPLWLQGLEDPELDDTSPIEGKRALADNWVKEVTDETDELQTMSSKSDENQDSGNSLPDWLNELSSINSDSPAILNDKTVDTSHQDSENAKEKKGKLTRDENIEIPEIFKKSEHAMLENLNVSVDGTPSEEDFIEISEFDLNDSPAPEQTTPHERFSGDEKLPQWLQEMVTDTTDKVDNEEVSVINKIDVTADPIETVIFPQGSNVIAEETSGQQAEGKIGFSDSLDNSTKPEPSTAIIEGDTTPVATQSEIYEDTETPQVFYETKLPQNIKLPQELHDAKNLLDHGNYQEAIKIFTLYIEDPSFQDEIQSWLIENVSTHAKTETTVWEILGDIALIQGKPEDAFDAYTKATNLLLIQKEERDETG